MLFGFEHFHQRLLQNEDASSDSHGWQLARLHHPVCGGSANAYKACGVLNGQRQCFFFMVFFCHGRTFTNERALSYIYMSSGSRAAPSHVKAEKERAKPLSSLLPRELVLAAFKTRDLSRLKIQWRAVSSSICLPLV
jgi:hypothetical protein